jgi:hypothetical protein
MYVPFPESMIKSKLLFWLKQELCGATNYPVGCGLASLPACSRYIIMKYLKQSASPVMQKYYVFLIARLPCRKRLYRIAPAQGAMKKVTF